MGTFVWTKTEYTLEGERSVVTRVYGSEEEALASIPPNTIWEIEDPGVRWKGSYLMEKDPASLEEALIEEPTYRANGIKIKPVYLETVYTPEQFVRLVMEYLDFAGDWEKVLMFAALASDVRPALRLLLEVEDREQ